MRPAENLILISEKIIQNSANLIFNFQIQWEQKLILRSSSLRFRFVTCDSFLALNRFFFYKTRPTTASDAQYSI